MAGSGRSRADERLIASLLGGATQAEAAEAAGMSERTVRRRLSDRAFNGALDDARHELMDRTLSCLCAGADLAVRTLTRIVEDSEIKPSVVVAACKTLLAEQRTYRDIYELGRRLDVVELTISRRELNR